MPPNFGRLISYLGVSYYAKTVGITYKTAWRHYKLGNIDGAYQLSSGTVVGPDISSDKHESGKTYIYTRVSSSENKGNLESQADRLLKWSTCQGFTVDGVVKEVGSGLNDSRPKLLKLLGDPQVKVIIVEHKGRLTRFGFNFIETLMKTGGQ